jgi:hypothetical protein
MAFWRYHRDAAGLPVFADRPMLLETREVVQNHMLGRLFAGAGKRSDDAKNAGSREKRPTIR